MYLATPLRDVEPLRRLVAEMLSLMNEDINTKLRQG
jgi:hypothetical protein